MNHHFPTSILPDRPILDTEWAIPKMRQTTVHEKISLYRQTIQFNKKGWFKVYLRKEDLAFNAIYYCETFNYFGNIEVIPMARNLERIYRTIPLRGANNQLFTHSNELITTMKLEEPLFFFCIQVNEEAAFEIEILCKRIA